MSRLSLVATAGLWMLCLGLCCHGQTLQAVYTSTRSVTGIVVADDGTVMTGTRGGMLARTADGAWRKFTMLDGLPSNEVLGVDAQAGVVVARLGTGCARLRGERWVADTAAKPPAPLIDGQICSATWKGQDCAANVGGLRIRVKGEWKPIPMPKSTGTHISALLDKGDALWAAVFGDGVYAWDGRAWSLVDLGLPERARAITAMAAAGDRLWLGTIRDGVWEYDGHAWAQRLQPDEPSDHNVQALFSYQGDLYASTLDSGLVVRSADGWRRVGTPELSSDTPRQMTAFGGSLYLRQSIGIVDRFDGKTWTKNALPTLPRKQCSALASDGERLYAAQWGGWSEFDGQAWTHHLDVSQLQGCQVTALLPVGGTLWVGTQGRGIAQVERATGKVKWHNELSGLPDDTIKCLAQTQGTVYAGTFSQGVAWLAPAADKWTTAPEVALSQITDLEPDGSGGLYVAARTGLWRLTADKQMSLIMPGIEVQALRLVGNDLWVGTRTGLLRL